jgi:protein-L-isoaspartate(D-aspartate) O-methyltransferase
VLCVGAATGYSAAVVSRIAAEVVALEEDESLAASARTALAECPNVRAVSGPLTGGWAPAAPYDVILLEGMTEVAPSVLGRQLADGGRLVCVEGKPPATKAMLYCRSGDDVAGRPVFDAAAALLPGFVRPPAFVF